MEWIRSARLLHQTERKTPSAETIYSTITANAMSFGKMSVDLTAMIDSAARSNRAVRIEWPGAFTSAKVPVYGIREAENKPLSKGDKERLNLALKIKQYIATLERGTEFDCGQVGHAVGRSAKGVGRFMTDKRMRLFPDIDVRKNTRGNRYFVKKGSEK